MDVPSYRSHMTTKLVDAYGGDRLVAEAAWVVHPATSYQDLLTRKQATAEDYGRVIRSMVKGRHTSPFEHGAMTMYYEAPAVVWWELTRHRFMSQERNDFSFNLESARYRVMQGVFYLPPHDRPLKEPDGFKAMRPEHVHDDTTQSVVWQESTEQHRLAWHSYKRMIDAGVAREVARMVLGPAIFYSGYVTANPLTWLHFFRLRTRGGSVPSYPQWEIEQVALGTQDAFRSKWPITYDAFVENGRQI